MPQRRCSVRRAGCWLIVVVLAAAAGARRAETAVVEMLDVAPVWSAHPVGFALITVGNRQAVGFYDADRRLTVAVRTLGERRWTFVPLPRYTRWDSHNYITMAVDRDGFLHLCADMHCSPLVYFRSRHSLAEPLTSESLESIHCMTGEREDRATYPKFLQDAAGNLVFMYRHGSSGDGDQILNGYDAAGRTWRRLLDQPLTSGRIGDATMNAYFHGPIRGPDGCFHLAWVWRDTSDCDTCHDVCYARSRDLVRWERSDGTPLILPITAATCEVIDPVPPGGGLINGLAKIGFDADKRPVISFHKYDESGHSQIYSARREDGQWRIRRTSEWSHRWEFGSGGSIEFKVGIGAVTVATDGTLVQDHSSVAGSGVWRLDPESLAAVGFAQRGTRYPPAALAAAAAPWPGMQVHWQPDSGDSTAARRFMLRWETLGPNRDHPRAEPLRPPTMLRVIEICD